MKYIISNRVQFSLTKFYGNVAKKYRNTVSKEDVVKFIREGYQSVYRIEKGPLRRIPTISRWKKDGVYMATIGNWNFAYKIEGDIIEVIDACHSQNMHEDNERLKRIVSIVIDEVIRRIIKN